MVPLMYRSRSMSIHSTSLAWLDSAPTRTLGDDAEAAGVNLVSEVPSVYQNVNLACWFSPGVPDHFVVPDAWVYTWPSLPQPYHAVPVKVPWPGEKFRLSSSNRVQDPTLLGESPT